MLCQNCQREVSQTYKATIFVKTARNSDLPGTLNTMAKGYRLRAEATHTGTTGLLFTWQHYVVVVEGEFQAYESFLICVNDLLNNLHNALIYNKKK